MTVNATYMPTPLESIPLEEALPFPLYVRIGEKYVQFRAIKDTLSQLRVEKLKEKVDIAFVPANFWLRYLETLEKMYKKGATDTQGHLSQVYSLALAYGKHLEHSRDDQKGSVNKLRSLGYEIGSITHERPELISKVLKHYREKEIYFSAHNANVAVYSVAIAHKLGYSVEELKFLTFGCLVHNIGNFLVPEDILYKPEELSETEWQAVKKHPFQGAQLLEYLNCPTEVVLTAKQHHERMDGAGYPLNVTGMEIHPFARICSIADVFDAMTSARPYKKSLNGKEAIQTMQTMVGKFDPQILKMFGTS